MHHWYRRGFRHHCPPWWYPHYDVPPIPEPGFDYPPGPYYLPPRFSKEDELKMLEEEEMALTDELEAIRKRITGLKNELKKEVK